MPRHYSFASALQHLDYPGEELLGTDIVREVLLDGFQGLACIRSGNNSEADGEVYSKSGAHCHFGKEMRMKDLISGLMRAWESHTATRPDIVVSDE